MVRTSLLRALTQSSKRAAAFSTSSTSYAPSPFRFPAMSPTMTEGGIAAWKKQEGESFSAGDVLLEIETDKATMDVETTEDGIMGKILVPEGTKEIQIGTLIAILAEEGDDLASLSADSFDSSVDSSPPPSADAASSTPASSSASSPTPESSYQSNNPSLPQSSSSSSSTPAHSHGDFTHSRPIAPGVMRLLLNQSTLSVEKISEMKGSGPGGRLTKGDVLKAMGKIETVWGSKEAEKMNKDGKLGASQFKLPPSDSKPTPASKPAPPQDPASLRRAVLSGLISAASPKPLPITAFSPTFESILSDYLPESNSEGAVELCAGPEIIVPSVESSSMCAAGAEGKKAEATDEWAGIW